MNSKWADKWIEALRSGKYIQGQGALTRLRLDKLDLDCCLGVVCKLVGGPKEVMGDVVFYGSSHEDGSYTNLPLNVVHALGMRSYSGVFAQDNYGGLGVSLTGCNDSGFTFSQIADIIDYFRDEL